MTKFNAKADKKLRDAFEKTDLKAKPFSLRTFADKKEILLKFNTISGNKFYQNSALSVSLFIDQIPFLINPNTEFSHKNELWKKYFNGTLSHNTIRLNLNNQSESFGTDKKAGPFDVEIIKTDLKKNIISIKARHNGYENIGAIHFREIIWDASKSLLRIKDTVEYEKKEFFFIELPFHFHSGIIVKQNNPITFEAIDKNENIIYLAIDKKFNTEMLKGQTTPQIMGWHNVENNKYEPSATVYCTLLANKTISFQTLFLIKPKPENK